MQLTLSVRLLGKPSYFNGVTQEAIANEHPLLLLTYLTAHEAWIERKEILALFFENDDESTARRKLRHLIFRANKHDWFEGLSSQPQHLKHDAQTDLKIFRTAMQEANWASAVHMYNGQLLKDTPITKLHNYEAWLEQEREDIETSFTEAAFWHAKELQAQQNYLQAHDVLNKLLNKDPLNEEAMQVYLKNAQHLDAQESIVKQYQNFKTQLESDLGMQPLEETIVLANQLIALQNQKQLETLSQKEATPELKNKPKGLSSFVGRDPELAYLISLLEQEDSKLISLIGIGGIGKTRLGLAVANDYAKTLKDGAVFIPLASTSYPDYLAHTMLTNLGLEPDAKQEPEVQIIDFLKDKEMLLLLDNFEQIIEASSFVQNLIEEAPQLKLLVTSRERLNLSQEQIFDLSGMALPEKFDENIPLEAYDGISLFLRAARRNQTKFTLNESNRHAIFTLCHTLEGVPLALELAASWLRLMNVAEILVETLKSFDLIESDFSDLPKRHQSLRAVFNSSWKLLSSDEQTTLVELSIFTGGFTLDAARTVSSKGPRSLLKLVNKSLIRRTETGRFEYLEVIRQYAFEKLLSNPEKAITIPKKHADYYANLSNEAQPHLKGSPEQLEWLNILENDHSNFRKALELLLTSNLKVAFEVANNLFYYWLTRGHWNEAKTYCEHIKQLSLNSEEAYLNASLQTKIGFINTLQGHYGKAETLLIESHELLKKSDDVSGYANSLAYLGINYNYQGDYQKAGQYLSESLALLKQNDFTDKAFVLHELGNTFLRQNKLAEAKQLFQEAFELRKEIHDLRGSAKTLMNLGIVARRQGKYLDAAMLYQESLTFARKVNDRLCIADSLNAYGVLVKLQGKHLEAEKAYTESLELYKTTGDKLGEAVILENIGILSRLKGNHEASLDYFTQCLENHKKRNDQWGTSRALSGLAMACFRVEQRDSALSYAKQAYSLAINLKNKQLLSQSLLTLAFILSHSSNLELAVQFLAMFDKLIKDTGAKLVPEEEQLRKDLHEHLSASLAKEAFAEAWLQGQTLQLFDLAEPFMKLQVNEWLEITRVS